MELNSEERLKWVLWKTKRSLEDLVFDNTTDHYIINEELYNKILKRINKVLGVKAKSNKDYQQ